MNGLDLVNYLISSGAWFLAGGVVVKMLEEGRRDTRRS